MKKIINIVGFACLFLFISCEKETEGISFETNYATFELTGGTPYNLPLGTAYTEPGVIAIAGEDELPVEASDNIDPTTLGIYEVNYSATNVDGFEATTTRTVAVYDPSAPATDFSADYISDMYRTNADGSGRREFPGLAVSVSKSGSWYLLCNRLPGRLLRTRSWIWWSLCNDRISCPECRQFFNPAQQPCKWLGRWT